MIHEPSSIPSSIERGVLKSSTKWKVFIGGRVGSKKIISKREGLFQRRLFVTGKSMVSHADYLIFLWEMERTHVTGATVLMDRKIS